MSTLSGCNHHLPYHYHWKLVTYMGVFPVVDNLLHVVERVKQEVITPFSPVNGHRAISVNTGSKSYTRN